MVLSPKEFELILRGSSYISAILWLKDEVESFVGVVKVTRDIKPIRAIARGNLIAV
jgi:DUF438 domain-containing protein